MQRVVTEQRIGDFDRRRKAGVAVGVGEVGDTQRAAVLASRDQQRGFRAVAQFRFGRSGNLRQRDPLRREGRRMTAEQQIDRFDHPRRRTEIAGQSVFGSAVTEYVVRGAVVGVDVAAAEAVDRLPRIADQKEGRRRHRAAGFGRVDEYLFEDRILDRVGILKLVHNSQRILLLKAPLQPAFRLHQRPVHVADHIVEGLQVRLLLGAVVSGDQFPDRRQQHRVAEAGRQFGKPENTLQFRLFEYSGKRLLPLFQSGELRRRAGFFARAESFGERLRGESGEQLQELPGRHTIGPEFLIRRDEPVKILTAEWLVE